MSPSRTGDPGESADPRAHSIPQFASAPGEPGMAADLADIESLVAKLTRDLATGTAVALPGNTYFLDDGRVLCRERQRGDSRYPYGRNGLNFWVHASGRMYGNNGLFFLFLPSGPGQDPPIAFFAGARRSEREPFAPLALLPVPLLPEGETQVVQRYTVIGHDATYFVTQTESLTTAVRVFVHQPQAGEPRIAFSLYLANTGKTSLDLYTSAYMNPFCRHQFGETGEDPWFKKVYVSTDADAAENALPPFVIAVNEDVDRMRSMTNFALVRRAAQREARASTAGAAPWLTSAVCTAQRGYFGSPRRGLASARFLTTGRFDEPTPLTVFNDNAVVGDLCRFALPAGEAAQLDYVLSLPADADALQRSLARPVTAGAVQAALDAVRAAAPPSQGHLAIEFQQPADHALDAATFNHFLSYLKQQVAVCAQTNGYMQPSPNSLVGIRDVFQAIEGHLYDDPRTARAKMLEALEYVLIDGRCPRQYSLPNNDQPGRADLREFIDQGAWVVSTLYTYAAATGDHAILHEPVGYHRVIPGLDHAIEPADETDTVLDHLVRIMDYLLRHRDPETGLLRALYGDWNDALDGLGTTDVPGEKFGTGVSVMATLQLYRNCAEIIELIERFAPRRCEKKRDQYARAREDLRAGLLATAIDNRGDQRRILHGWGDNRSYLVGGFADSDGQARDGLTSNAFWVIAGMLAADPSLRDDVLAAFDRLDGPYGLKTFEPGFEPDAPGVGRIPKLPIGTAENGAAYVHATTFGIMALFLMGEPRRAWDQIHKILPFAPHQQGLSHTPFVMPNSYAHNPELNLTGQNMNDWQTGCSNVLLKLIIWHVFGVQPTFDAVRLAPATFSPFGKASLTCTLHGRRLRVVLRRGDVAARTFVLNGKPLGDAVRAHDTLRTRIALVPYAQLETDKENTIEVVDPASA